MIASPASLSGACDVIEQSAALPERNMNLSLTHLCHKPLGFGFAYLCHHLKKPHRSLEASVAKLTMTDVSRFSAAGVCSHLYEMCRGKLFLPSREYWSSYRRFKPQNFYGTQQESAYMEMFVSSLFP